MKCQFPISMAASIPKAAIWVFGDSRRCLAADVSSESFSLLVAR